MASSHKNKRLKKKKEEFGADHIDNTAPIKKILDGFFATNRQAYAFYIHNLRKSASTVTTIVNFHADQTGYPLNAFGEDWDGDVKSGYFETFPYKSMKPKYITPMNNIEKADPVTELLKKKKEWFKGITSFKCQSYLHKIPDSYQKLNPEVVLCPKYMVTFAEHVDRDPDPYFNSAYNWYYAGNGNMQTVCIHWVEYILHSVFDCLYLSEFSKQEMNINFNHVTIFKCNGNNILETVCSTQNLVALRTMHKVYILKIVTDDSCNIHFENVKNIESEMPFTSISFDNFHKNILYLSRLDNNLTIVNLDRLKGRNFKLKCSVNSLENNWNCVLGNDRLTYTHVAPNAVTVYDKRTNVNTFTYRDLKNVVDYVGCNNITAAKLKENGKAIYVGTNHHLFLLDLRNTKKHKPRPVQRWTHGMQTPPAYISVTDFEFDKELICLSGQWCGDMCVIDNYKNSVDKGPELLGVTMPYRPPSVLEVLNDAREQMLCNGIDNHIESRLSTAITGQLVIKQDDKQCILLQNSLGDITHHILYPEHLHIFIQDDSVLHLEEWSKAYKKQQEIFEVSFVNDIANVWKSLKKIPEDYNVGECSRVKCYQKSDFNEQEIFDAFESEDIEGGLLDIWIDNEQQNETVN